MFIDRNGTLQMTDCLVAGNQQPGTDATYYGGGIGLYQPTSASFIRNSTISANTASGGGAIKTAILPD